MKKLITAMLALVLLLSCLHVNAFAASLKETSGTIRIENGIPLSAEKERVSLGSGQAASTGEGNTGIISSVMYAVRISMFMADPRWINGATWKASQRPKLSTYSSTGCCAYCADFVKFVFGKDSPRSGTAFYSASAIRGGDILVFKNTSHWVVVLGRDGNQLTTMEGNWGGKVLYSTSAYSIVNGRVYRNGSPFRTLSVAYHFK